MRPLFSWAILMQTWHFMFIFVKRFLNSWTKINGPCKVHTWIGFGCGTRNRRDIFFLAYNRMELIRIWHRYLLNHLNLFLNDERIVFFQVNGSPQSKRQNLNWTTYKKRLWIIFDSKSLSQVFPWSLNYHDKFYLRRWNIIVWVFLWTQLWSGSFFKNLFLLSSIGPLSFLLNLICKSELMWCLFKTYGH